MDEERSSNISGFTDIIQASRPYSMIFSPFAVLNQELSVFASGHFLRWDGGSVQLPSTAMLLCLEHGGSFSSSVQIFFDIHVLMCSLSWGDIHDEM